MANRELVIVFVYDTQKCLKEEDNPDDAVLFFHPGWVSEQQRISLCGQLMGTSFFIMTTFSQPSILCLQSGKFAIRYFGRYIMAMGTDRNIPEWVLEQRADLMTSLLKLYFKDMDNLAASCIDAETVKERTDSELSTQSVSESVSSEEQLWENFQNQGGPATLQEKLSRIFETFLPIVQYTGQLFANVPTVRLPKSAINVYLEGIRILRSCQELKGVLGGTLLYQNKVIASQLSSSLTKHLVISDPYRIKSPGESVHPPFALPVGVQLLKIYVCVKELRSLRKKAKNVRSTFPKAEAASKVSSGKQQRDSQPDLFAKRNKSLIFTVPEEDDSGVEDRCSIFHPQPQTTDRRSKTIHTTIESTPPEEEIFPEEPEPFPAPVPIAACGKGASLVCSTPARDVNVIKLLSGKAVSICNNTDSVDQGGATPDGEKKRNADASKQTDLVDRKVTEGESWLIPDVVRDAVEARKAARRCRPDQTELRPRISSPPENKNKIEFLSREPLNMPLSTSLDSLHHNAPAILPLRYYGLGLPRVPPGHGKESSPTIEAHDRTPSPQALRPGRRGRARRKPGHRFYNTITDPCFPVFWNDGLPLSRSLFDQYLTQHYQLLGAQPPTRRLSQQNNASTTATAHGSANASATTTNEEAKPFQRRPSDLPVVPIANPAPSTKRENPPTEPMPAAAAPASRRPLSLALNTVIETQNSENASIQPECRRKRIASQALPSVARPTSLSGGLALTPLMAKLSHLALDASRQGPTTAPVEEQDHREVTYHQRVETPITPRPPPLRLPNRNESKIRTESLTEPEGEIDETSSEDVVLFVCGMQSTTLFLLVEKSLATTEELLQSLREITSTTMEPLELLLHRSLENFPASGDGSELYSYMCLDPEWGAIQRGGVWSANDLELAGSLHKDFKSTRTLTEVCLRAQDSLVYGYQCGKSQVFYQQQISGNAVGAGLPTPADPMGTVPLKARRCLERDHGIILL